MRVNPEISPLNPFGQVWSFVFAFEKRENEIPAKVHLAVP